MVQRRQQKAAFEASAFGSTPYTYIGITSLYGIGKGGDGLLQSLGNYRSLKCWNNGYHVELLGWLRGVDYYLAFVLFFKNFLLCSLKMV